MNLKFLKNNNNKDIINAKYKKYNILLEVNI